MFGWEVFIPLMIILLIAIARIQMPLWAWLSSTAFMLSAGFWYQILSYGYLVSLTTLWFTAFLIHITPLRKACLSIPALAHLQRMLPPISKTEEQALQAGSEGWEKELFQGNPHWKTLHQYPLATLDEHEQQFLDHEVNQLCGMLNDWEINQELNDLPPEVWDYLKQHGFFALNIPKEYGGKGFSSTAHSHVIVKIASRSVTAAVTVMVPNSLGPAELLLRYGTTEQKDHHLPRLASGQDIPCFALTAPTAGSDAASIPDTGIVCKDMFEGEEVLGLRLNWDKRYITLAPIATLLGLAFKAEDPDHLLGDTVHIGMSCALIPTDTTGVQIGHRHQPMGLAFLNGPTQGKDVFIPMDFVIGGQAQLGNGWMMLMECLATGRGISLPALSVASGKLCSRYGGAYARMREQFHLPIGRFEGVEEVLARIAGFTYIMESGRQLMLSSLAAGEHSAVSSAIIKCYLTEYMRDVVNDAMDIHGGRAISAGPSNYLSFAYQAIPVGITVEGANILTRSLIIFGQGSIRCHPYLQAEINAARNNRGHEAIKQFDSLLFSHIGYVFSNMVRAFVYSLSRGRLAPHDGTSTAHYARHLSMLSAIFAVCSDFTLLTLGGSFRRKEKLSGRFSDALGHLYLGSAVLKHYQTSPDLEEDKPAMQWAIKHCLHRIEHSLDEILRHFPSHWLGKVLRLILMPLGKRFRAPHDNLGRALAELLLCQSDFRERLSSGMYINQDPEDCTGKLEHALPHIILAQAIERRLYQAKKKIPQNLDYRAGLDLLLEQDKITQKELDQLIKARDLLASVIAVDAFNHGAKHEQS
ncbi:MAG: acyl-CoA dehydrogenase [Mariprofundaceae bacterium]|nr:acyl-CoA dehydrogenase [Mariprofundaceae bacterium]